MVPALLNVSMRLWSLIQFLLGDSLSAPRERSLSNTKKMSEKERLGWKPHRWRSSGGESELWPVSGSERGGAWPRSPGRPGHHPKVVISSIDLGPATLVFFCGGS